MAITLQTTSRQLRRTRWAPGQAIRSGASPNQAVGTLGLIEEVHHGYAYSTRVLGATVHPGAVALWTEAGAALVLIASLGLVHSPGILRYRAIIEAADAQVRLRVLGVDGTVVSADSGSLVARQFVELEVTVPSNPRYAQLWLRRDVTSGTVYGVTWLEDVLIAAELPV